MRLEEVAHAKFVILGAARSGVAAAKLLKRRGADVVIADEKAVCAATATLNELDAVDVRSFWGERGIESLAGRTVMVKSPGIPQGNAVVTEARRRGIRVISEIEFASAFVSPAARIVAITGTNGKTTTTAWIAHILQAAGFNAVLAGNIGDAWSNSADLPQNQTDRTVFVVECSSFQLEDIEHFHPHIALLTNFSPDHMDRYDDDLAKYAAAKRNILKNMTVQDVFVLNADDEASRGFGSDCPAQVWRFGRSNPELIKGPGAFTLNGDISLRTGPDHSHPILPAAQMPVPGGHNLENALAAAVASHLAGASDQAIREGLLTFKGVEHRIELCGVRADGVRFYNDSKATNLDAMEKALKAFEKPIIVIAGGRDAHSDYTSINDLVQRYVKRLITIGEAAPLIESAWSELVPTHRADSMADAVRRAAEAADPNDIIVLSPACKSFDMYNNFEERGRDFKQCVQSVLNE
ncbi:MAG: UDP-N-acetylmuramoyl-L-alanine--D-glutamate ligase [Candidatus Sumerlaeaceae bacterium]